MRWPRAVFDARAGRSGALLNKERRFFIRPKLTTTPYRGRPKLHGPGAAARVFDLRWCQHRTPGVMQSKPLKPLRAERRMCPACSWRLCSCAFSLLHMRLRMRFASGVPCALNLGQANRTGRRRARAIKNRADDACFTLVITGLVPVIHVLLAASQRRGWPG